MTQSEEKFKTGTSYLLPFEKMHGLGNDFILVNAAHLAEQDNQLSEQELTTKICDRHRGIGADGLIVIDQVKDSAEAIRSWRYYNADGSIAEMCGNGIRCAAKYIYEHGLSGEGTTFKIETLAGDIALEMLEDDMVRVDMGAPRDIQEGQELNIADFKFPYTSVSMGNPHAVSFWQQDLAEVQDYGPKIECHESFPNKTNVEFARIVDSKNIDLVVWERGCGFTQACGTGACATVVAAILAGHCTKDEDIAVKLPGGTLVIKWDSVADIVFMTGPAVMVYLGYYNS